MDVSFDQILDFVRAIIIQGGLYALVAMGLVLTFQIVRFPDLTPDGSFTLGGAVAAKIIFCLNTSWAAILGTAGAFLAGGAAGYLTAFLSVRMRISRILSGILVMTMLYTISLRIMGKGNLTLVNKSTVLSPFESVGFGDFLPGLVIASVALIFSFLIYLLLKSEAGLLLRAGGQNALAVEGTGHNPAKFTTHGVALANSLIALGGALAAQMYGFGDINLGVGTLVSGLACLFLGRALVKSHAPGALLVAALVGSVVYVGVRNIALRLGLEATDLKLVTALIVILVLAVRLRRGANNAFEDLF